MINTTALNVQTGQSRPRAPLARQAATKRDPATMVTSKLVQVNASMVCVRSLIVCPTRLIVILVTLSPPYSIFLHKSSCHASNARKVCQKTNMETASIVQWASSSQTISMTYPRQSHVNCAVTEPLLRWSTIRRSSKRCQIGSTGRSALPSRPARLTTPVSSISESGEHILTRYDPSLVFPRVLEFLLAETWELEMSLAVRCQSNMRLKRWELEKLSLFSLTPLRF